MRIAILHYHLRPGGVTRVIENARLALAAGRDIHIATIAGSEGADALVPELDYAPTPADVDVGTLASRLEVAAQRALGGAPDLWHIHNHSLGRHPIATAAFAELARRGHRLLLQIHDFAEDGRPENYRSLRERWGHDLPRVLYPAASHVHYATLNPRDRHALAQAGVPDSQLHDLPNPAAPPPGGAPEANARASLILYPTRALRRKNVGEFLLWAALERDGHSFALTLAPTSPADLAPYTRWKAFANRLNLPVAFEAGLQPNATLPDLLAQSAAVATTSIAEGFGLSFIEPWLANRSLVGRALPEITADLVAGGLQMDDLYERLDIPLAWIGADRLRARIQAALQHLASSYDEPLALESVEKAWQAFVHNSRVDFGRLDEPLQQEVIERLHRDSRSRDEILPSNLLPLGEPDRRVENRAVVKRLSSLPSYADRLTSAYHSVAHSATGAVAAYDAASIRHFFLDPQRLFLLRAD
ncbi:MAG: hypothetical protein M9963_04075 [Kiritimatiellae bacterium]|nr:hypothetical protein [Kiritimatiellia bacterium]MCO5067767.1 hypothetical protein [Kiritimatiellia bacterium]